MRPQRYHVTREAVNSARGRITGFSKKSRQRLIEKMARLDVENVRSCFLTLTFHGMPEATEATRAFKMFCQRLRRKFPKISLMWRKEFQERGSAHYHLICFNMPYWKQAAIQRCWEECTRENRSIVHIKLLRNKKQAMYYVSKYIAKVPDTGETPSLVNTPYQHERELPSTGRLWGYLGKIRLPMARIRRAYIVDDQTSGYLAFACRAMARGNVNKFSPTRTIYTDEAYQIFTRAIELGGFEREIGDMYEFLCILNGNQPSDFMRDRYAQSTPYIDWRKATDQAYKKLEQQWLSSQRLNRAMYSKW